MTTSIIKVERSLVCVERSRKDFPIVLTQDIV